MGIQYIYRRLPENELNALETDIQRAMAYLFSIPGLDLSEMMTLMNDPNSMKENSAKIIAALENAQPDPTRVDVDKDWHALHFLLTNDSSMSEEHKPNEPLHNVVMGGHPTAIESTYGPVRKFLVEDMRQIQEALASLDIDKLRSEISVEAFNAADIYPNPQPGGWDKEEIEYVLEIIPRIRQLFSDAITANEVVIVYAA